MSTELDEFWIFSTEGKCVFHVTLSEDRKSMTESECDVNKDMFNKFKTIIEKQHGKRAQKDFITYNTGWGKYTFKYFYKNHFLLIYQSSLERKDKNIREFCKALISMFEGMYKLKDIEDWDGDPAFFKKLKSKLRLYIKMSSI